MGCWRQFCRLTVVSPRGTVTSWALSGVGAPDLAVVDTIARVGLQARRAGGRIVLSELCTDMVDLLDLVGLAIEVVGEGGDAFGAQDMQAPGPPA